MMKYNCDIVRDLMPLCVDGAASEPSRQMVVDHVLECRDCMQVYQEMRTEVPKEPPVDKDAAPFGNTVRRLRRKRNKRRTLAVLAGVAAGVLLVALCILFQVFMNTYDRIAPPWDYQVSLSRDEAGRITLSLQNNGGYAMRISDDTLFCNWETGELQIVAETTRIRRPTLSRTQQFTSSCLYWDAQTNELRFHPPFPHLIEESGQRVMAVQVAGSGQYIDIWNSGDAIELRVSDDAIPQTPFATATPQPTATP